MQLCVCCVVMLSLALELFERLLERSLPPRSALLGGDAAEECGEALGVIAKLRSARVPKYERGNLIVEAIARAHFAPQRSW